MSANLTPPAPTPPPRVPSSSALNALHQSPPDAIAASSPAGSAYNIGNGTPNGSITRTLAVLLGDAVDQRLAVESRLNEAGFEIVADRMEEWSIDDDEELLSELLAGEADIEGWAADMTAGPIMLYVLERRRAAQLWNDLIGPPDDQVVSQEAPQSLRALYGARNLYGSPVGFAELQIALVFPELANEEALLAQEPDYFDIPRNGETGSGPASVNSASDRGTFKARPAPSSTRKLSIEPRMSRAAALRMGIELPKPAVRTQSTSSGTTSPDEPRRVVPIPKSLAQPSVAPRPTRASALRTGVPPTDPPARSRTGSTTSMGSLGSEGSARSPTALFDNVPGHKRRESIAVASTRAPSMAPRQTKASALRAQRDSALSPPPLSHRTTSTASVDSASSQARSTQRSASASSGAGAAPGYVRERRQVDFSGTPGHKRAVSYQVASTNAPSIAPRQTKASALRAGNVGDAVPSPQRRSADRTVDFSNTPGHKRSSTSYQVASTNAPSLAPRQTKASALRAGNGGGDTGDAPSGSAGRRASVATSSPVSAGAGAERKTIDFSNTPGHKRVGSYQVASIRAPTIAPRATKASQLRESKEADGGGGGGGGAPRRPQSVQSLRTAGPKPGDSVVNSGRRSSLDVSRSTAPTITPRPNRAALLRAEKGGVPTPTGTGTGAPPPSSYRFSGSFGGRPASAQGV